MQEKTTPYLRELFNSSPTIARQYSQLEDLATFSLENRDPLEEDAHEVTKGLVHKYTNRALVKTSYRCAAHCQFCTRTRQIGSPSGDLTPENEANIVTYIRAHTEIDDVIFSGGDPLYTPNVTLRLLRQVSEVPSVKVLRIGTRLPVHNPDSFNTLPLQNVVEEIDKIAQEKPFFVLINFQHPDEMTPKTMGVVSKLKETGATLLSQTVFLKDINDDEEVLYKLFQGLYHSGVVPYYMYRCDYAKGLEKYICDLNKERAIMTSLRTRLSGIACPTYVVDVEGMGKIPVPLDFWQANSEECLDFNGNCISIRLPNNE